MGGGQVGRQVELELVADDEIDARLALEPVEPRLGVTAGHGDERMGRMFEGFSDQVPRCTLGLFRHRAGIQHEQVRRSAEFDQFEPSSAEPFSQHRRFSVVQPAS